MGCKQTELVPNDLEAAKKRFDTWRRRRKRGSRIPDHLWDYAAKLAAEYGICRAARVLRLDYYGLKKRAESEVPARIRGAAHNVSESIDGAKVKVPVRLRDVSGGIGIAEGRSSAGVSQMVSPATFVELSPPATYASPECVIELANPHGSKMRVYLKGNHVAEVVELCRDFWDVEG